MSAWGWWSAIVQRVRRGGGGTCRATAQRRSFALTDQHGQPFGSADIGQRAALVSFVFTTCTEWCPVLSPKLREAQEQLRAEGLLGSRVLLLSITVDPQRDTPDKLAAYARALRGRSEPLALSDRAAGGDTTCGGRRLSGRVVCSPAPTARDGAAVPLTITHSNRFVIVDAAGQIRSYLRGEEVTPAEIMRAHSAGCRVGRPDRQWPQSSPSPVLKAQESRVT